MGDFGMTEKDVIIIDSTNIASFNYQQEFQGKIGMD